LNNILNASVPEDWLEATGDDKARLLETMKRYNAACNFVAKRDRFDRIKGQSDLIYRGGVFYLITVVDVPDKSEYDPIGVLGVDLGIENIAVDSDREIFESKKVEDTRQRYTRLRSSLQHLGTKSAKRKLKRLSGKERRFKKDTNHVISKHIISKAKGTTRTIGIENLKHIRSRVTVRRSQRDRHSKWAFGQLRDFLTYKAKREGVPLKVVKSENTSRQCPKCQHIDKRNRKTRNLFECLKCGYIETADYVAAINIAAKAWPSCQTAYCRRDFNIYLQATDFNRW
jgi:putative transposase